MTPLRVPTTLHRPLRLARSAIQHGRRPGVWLVVLAAAATLSAGPPPQPARIALIAATVLPVVGASVSPGVVLIDDGRITRVAAGDRAPDGYTPVDVRPGIVVPGLVDAHSHIGLQTLPRVPGNFDIAENSEPLMPQVRVLDAIRPTDPAIAQACSFGITTAVVLPGSSDLIGGQGLVIKTNGTDLASLTAIDRPILKMALGINPKSAFGRHGRSPKTRMATGAMLRDAFIRAQAYAERRRRDPTSDVDLSLEPLVAALERRVPIQVHAVQADEIMLAVHLMEDFGLTGSIAHAYEGHFVAAELARRHIPVVVGPLLTGWEGGKDADPPINECGRLVDAGVEVSIMTDSYIPDLFLQAAYAVRLGLDEDVALRAITLHPARIAGLGDRVGSLEPGKDADVVVLDGPPFALNTRVQKVFIHGKVAFDRTGS